MFVFTDIFPGNRPATYVRFALPGVGRRAPTGDGAFTVAYDLLENHDLDDFERGRICTLLDWFDQHLPAPDCLMLTDYEGAICWFRSSSHRHLRRMCDLAKLLRSRGAPLGLYKSREPGEIVYRDRWQIVAKPLRR